MNDHQYNNQYPLDNWLKEAASLPATDGIDQPDPAVWEGIQNVRAAQRRRKRFLFWWWLVGAALVVGGIVLLFLSERRSVDQAVPAPVAVENATDKGECSTTETKTAFTLTFSDQAAKPVATPILKGSPSRLQQKNTQTDDLFLAASILPELESLAPPEYPANKADRQEAAGPPVRPTNLVVLPLVNKLIIPLSRKAPAFSAQCTPKSTVSGPSLYTGAQTMIMFGNKQYHSIQTGWLAGYQINQHWSVESGLQYLQSSRLVQHEGRMRYRAGLTRPSDAPSQQILESNGMEDIETQLGEVTLRYTLSRDIDQPIPDQEWVQLKVRTKEQNSFWRIPVLLRFQSGMGRWYWTAAGGGGINLSAGSGIKVQSADTPNGNIRSVRAVALGLRARSQTALLHGELHMAAGFRFGKHWSAELAPGLQFGSRQLYFKDSDRPNVFTGGIQCRFLYNFQ